MNIKPHLAEPTVVQKNKDRSGIIFDNVTKAYGDAIAVEAVSLEIQDGTLVSLLGPSGCGKTTTLRMIAGLELPTSGRIMIGSKDVTNLPATYRNISMVFQSYALFPHMTVLDNVAYGLKMSGVKLPVRVEKSEDTLRLVGLAGMGRRLPSELSGGQQQRVALARAIVLEPDVLLLDEPLSNLDTRLRRYVREEIRDLQRKLGVTTVYVTHDQEEAMAVSDKIIVMEKGRIVQHDAPVDLYRNPNSAFIASFIGEANLLDCIVATNADGSKLVEIGDAAFSVQNSSVGDGPATLVIRSEAMALSEPEQNGIRGDLFSATFLGDRMLYGIDSALGRLFYVDYRPSRNFPSGTTVGIKFDESKLRLV